MGTDGERNHTLNMRQVNIHLLMLVGGFVAMGTCCYGSLDLRGHKEQSDPDDFRDQNLEFAYLPGNLLLRESVALGACCLGDLLLQ